MTVTCFLPCRAGSERVPNKNVRTFGGLEGGLLRRKLQQLHDSGVFDQILVSSNDVRVLEIASEPRFADVRIHERSDELSASTTSTDDLVPLVAELIPEGAVVWTHVTSPFVDAALYRTILSRYLEALAQGHDSLMTVSDIRGFVWDARGPINYDRDVEKWPRTQTLGPLYEVNSAAFVSDVETYRTHHDRIGARPMLMSLHGFAGLDIDWETDFKLAELVERSGLADQ